MSQNDVLELLARASADDRFLAQLSDDFRFAVRDYDLTEEEKAALASGDIRRIEDHVGPLKPSLRRWLDCRVQQDRYAGDSFEDRLNRIFASSRGERGNLIPLLQRVQAEFGYLPEQAMFRIAEFAGVPESRVFGVSTFFAQFRFRPVGKKHVVVCRGTGCHVRGSPRILDELQKTLGIREGETTADREYSLETVACIGACGLSPCVTVNKRVFTKMTPKKVRALVGRSG